MAEVRKLIKSYRIVNPWGIGVAIPYIAVIWVLVTLAFIHVVTYNTLIYLERGGNYGFKGYFVLVLCSFSLIEMLVMGFINVELRNYNNFLIQLPLLKKGIFGLKYIILLMAMSMNIVTTVYFIIFNYFAGNEVYLTAYTGVAVLGNCIFFIFLSVILGVSNLSSLKIQFLVRIVRRVFSMLVFAGTIYYISIDFLPIRKNYEMYNSLGEWLAPVLKASGVFGGFGGLLLLAVSIVVGYYLCVTLPLKISEREG